MKRIGIFDSGVGGLTVVNELFKRLPRERIVYFGDTARLPYGSKSKETVINYSLQNTRFLIQQDVKLIIAACNTASSIALDYLKMNFNIPIIGVIQPGVEAAIKATMNGKIGIIGTYATINSHAYKTRINKINSKLKVYETPCPLFVPLVEENILEGDIIQMVIDLYINDLIKKDIDVLVLGCTHYPLLKKALAKYCGKQIKIIDSASYVIQTVSGFLQENKILLTGNNGSLKNQFFASDLSNSFLDEAKKFLHDANILFTKVTLSESWVKDEN